MGKQFAILIGAAALGAALMAAGASADFRSVDDPRGDRKCHHGPCSDSMKRSVDIVRATAGHERGHLKHTIRVAGRAPGGGALRINTDSDPGCEWKIGIPHRGEFNSSIKPCSGQPNASTRCCAEVHRPPHSVHNVVITFKRSKIGSPRSYGWRAETHAHETIAGPRPAEAGDHVPNRGHYIRHRLGQPAAKAPRVVKYDTTLTITKEGAGGSSGLYHGQVLSEVSKCMKGRRVVLFKRRPGPDRKVGTARSRGGDGWFSWSVNIHRDYGDRVYAKVKRKVRDRYVCRADTSTWHD